MKKLMSVVFAAALAGTAWAETSADVLIWDINTKEDKASYDGATRNFDTIKFWAIDSNKQETDLTQYTYIGPEYLLANNAEGLAGSGGKIRLPATERRRQGRSTPTCRRLRRVTRLWRNCTSVVRPWIACSRR